MDRIFTIVSGKVSAWAGKPITFIIATALIVIWAAGGPLFRFSDTWQLVVNTTTTIITFLMVFIIQNSQNRDGAAMQAKLDELIRAIGNARAQYIAIEHLTDSQIEEIRTGLEREARQGSGHTDPKSEAAHRSLGKLLERY